MRKYIQEAKIILFIAKFSRFREIQPKAFDFRLSVLLSAFGVFRYFQPETRRLSLEPYAVVRRESLGIDSLFIGQINAVARAYKRRQSHGEEHERSEVAVLHSVTVFVTAYLPITLFIYDKEQAEIYAAPIIAKLEIIAITVFFRSVSAQTQKQGGGKTYERKRKSPRKSQ